MNCSFCNKTFKPSEPGQTICDDCKETVDELTNGKEDDEDE